MSSEEGKTQGVYAVVIPKFVETLINHKPPTIHGDGEQSRDFTYIENVIQMNILALLSENEKSYGECLMWLVELE